MSNKALLILFIGLLFPIFPSQASAAFSFSISGVEPSVISSKNQEVIVSLSIIDLPSESYFRAAFQKEGGATYFGYVKNNNSLWTKINPLNGDCTGYFKITDTSTTSATLTLKIGDDNEAENGVYMIKAHRFTSSGCSYTASDENSVFQVTINLPTPEPSPTATPIPPTPTPTPTKTPTPTPTKTPTPKPTKSESGGDTISENSNTEVDVLGLRNQLASEEPSPSPNEESSKKKSSVLPVILIIFGAGLMGFAGYTLFKKMKTEGYNNQDGENI